MEYAEQGEDLCQSNDADHLACPRLVSLALEAPFLEVMESDPYEEGWCGLKKF
jgi:hypothetical protein